MLRAAAVRVPLVNGVPYTGLLSLLQGTQQGWLCSALLQVLCVLVAVPSSVPGFACCCRVVDSYVLAFCPLP